MGNIFSANKHLPTSTPSSGTMKPIIKQPAELDLNQPNKWNKFFRKNSYAVTKVRVQSFDRPPRKATQIFQNKTTSSLHYVFTASSSFEMSRLISNLKDSCHITSLNLDLSSVESWAPQGLKYLSMTLGNFKNLTSLTLTFPNSVEMTPKHVSSLGFAFHRLRSLIDLSLKFSHQQRPNSSSLKLLAKILSKLTWLKSLTLGQFASTTHLALSFLSSILKKLTSLEGLNLDLADMRDFQSKHLNQVFLTLKNNKPLKNITFNFKDCLVDFPNSCPLSQGLAMLDLSQLQSFQLNCYSNLTNKTLEQLTAVLQAAPLKRLNLDLSKDCFYSSSLQFCLDLQAFQSLSHLSVNPGDLKNGIQGVGTALKFLGDLKFLDIDFSKQVYAKVDNELADFTTNLRGLQKLKSFSLNLKGLSQLPEKDLRALSETLQCLTELSSLNLELALEIIYRRKEVLRLFSSLTKLKNLTDLSLNSIARWNFSIEELRELAEVIQNLSLLTSVNLNFGNCEFFREERESFGPLFRSLGKLKFLKTIILHLPDGIEDQMVALDYIKHVENQTIHWDCLTDYKIWIRRLSE